MVAIGVACLVVGLGQAAVLAWAIRARPRPTLNLEMIAVVLVAVLEMLAIGIVALAAS